MTETQAPTKPGFIQELIRGGEPVRDTELVIVRHGEAVVNLQPSRDGRCLGLTERGRGQAAAVAARLAAQAASGRGFDAAYHSTRQRCVETAAIVGRALGIPIEPCDELRSSDHGQQGVDPWIPTENSIGTIPPLAPELAPTPGGESWQHYLERAGAALLEITWRRIRSSTLPGRDENGTFALMTSNDYTHLENGSL